MSEKNFKIKHGLNLGDHELITSDGNIVLPVGKTITDSAGKSVGLPTQTGQVGKFLTTNGSEPTWENIANSTTRVTSTATAGQTSFPVNYTIGEVDVYLNGIKLTHGTDFTASSGTEIVLTYGASLNDVIDIVAFGTFQIANTYTKGAVDSMVSNISWPNVQNKPVIPTISVVGSSLYITT